MRQAQVNLAYTVILSPEALQPNGGTAMEQALTANFSPDAIASQFVLFVALVLATVSVVEIATVRGSARGGEARRWATKSRR